MKRWLSFPLFLLVVVLAAGWTLPSTAVNKTKLLQLVNAARAKGCQCGDTWYGPAPAVTWNDLLEKAAQAHVRDMSKTQQFSHNGSDGSDPGQRIKRQGYQWSAYGENIAWGHEYEAAVINGWLKSPGHCRNIMNPKFKNMAVARSGTYWAQDFGSRR